MVNEANALVYAKPLRSRIRDLHYPVERKSLPFPFTVSRFCPDLKLEQCPRFVASTVWNKMAWFNGLKKD
jgi:hypothetical protein